MTAKEAFMTPEENRAFFKKFGKHLASIRKRCGLTQVQMAEILGYSQTQIASFETGRRRMPLSALPVLSKALGVSFDELLGEESRPSKRGPASKLERQLQRLATLPKVKQKLLQEMLEGLLQSA